MTLSRRDLLRGLFSDAEAPPKAPASSPDTTPSHGTAPAARPTMAQSHPHSIDPAKEPDLPRVISWLADYMNTDEVPPAAPCASHASTGSLLVRPPGAVAEDLFLARCTRCADCIEACPHHAIVGAPARFRDAAGTPSIDASVSPCRMCEDFPCIAACEPQALVDNADKMGTARVRRFDCLNELGSPCSSCIEHCPVEGAIAWGRVSQHRTKTPVVSDQRCTGCGVCHFVCPAPVNAIAILPNIRRRSKANDA